MKLTVAIKNSIVLKVTREKFDPLFAEMDNKRVDLACRIYAAIPGIANAYKLPDGWLPSVSSLQCYFGGQFVYLPLGKECRLPVRASNKGIRFGTDDPFTAEHVALAQEQAVLEQRRDEVKREVKAILAQVNTIKQLLEIWPDAAAYLPKEKAPLPAVANIDRLKQLLAQ